MFHFGTDFTGLEGENASRLVRGTGRCLATGEARVVATDQFTCGQGVVEYSNRILHLRTGGRWILSDFKIVRFVRNFLDFFYEFWEIIASLILEHWARKSQFCSPSSTIPLRLCAVDGTERITSSWRCLPMIGI